jgi:hypothetical protein
MVSTRTVALAVTGALAVLAAGIVGATVGDDVARSTDTPVATTATPAATVTSDPTATHAPRGPATSPPRPGEAPATRTTGPAAADTPAGGIEMLPTPVGDPTSTAYSLPAIPTAKPAPLLGATLPAPALAKGRLVQGFPAALAPPHGTSVESSSVSVANNVLQAALVARGGDPQAVVLHYRSLLIARGFVQKATQGVENAPAASFRKGKDSVTVTTQDGKTYLIAHLRPKGANG